MEDEKDFSIGDLVIKKQGYLFRGVVVAAFETIEKKKRIVVEFATTPMLHIFRPSQLRMANGDETNKIAETILERDRSNANVT